MADDSSWLLSETYQPVWKTKLERIELYYGEGNEYFIRFVGPVQAKQAIELYSEITFTVDGAYKGLMDGIHYSLTTKQDVCVCVYRYLVESRNRDRVMFVDAYVEALTAGFKTPHGDPSHSRMWAILECFTNSERYSMDLIFIGDSAKAFEDRAKETTRAKPFLLDRDKLRIDHYRKWRHQLPRRNDDDHDHDHAHGDDDNDDHEEEEEEEEEGCVDMFHSSSKSEAIEAMTLEDEGELSSQMTDDNVVNGRPPMDDPQGWIDWYKRHQQ
ncbi:hypothetical protein LTR78_010588 [Recurvomyces mirabilis]|uniref:Uncharacterized protein n=1 Tax=Recurvomyces mirabilis TaxID=574656 RepID=A0AAE0WG59_9PEZI|nr:hypothetical protein LTR78_010588 [Recurvomyces mirabilis]KAK5150132.1 hypothetical protein LTS14_010395 [Recurvomyces mirabilis]